MDEEEATTIHDLPTEVLIQVFQKLTKDSDLVKAQEVCSLWSQLVNEKVGRRVRVGEGESFGARADSSCGQVELEQLSQIGVQSCYITMKNENQEERKEENPAGEDLLYPYLLKELYLRGSIPPNVFVRLISARNVSIFEITSESLSKLRNENLKNLPFQSLKKLKVNANFDEDDTTGILPNLKTLLAENPFPQLTHLNLTLGPACFTDLAIMDTMIAYVQNHRSLQDFSLSYTDMFSNRSNIVMPVAVPHTHHESKTTIDGIRKRRNFNLKKLSIYTYTNPDPNPGFPSPVQIEIIEEFLLKVASLEYLRLIIPHSSSTLQSVCTRNSTTLQNLSIDSKNAVIDWSAFASLQCAKSIVISLKHHGFPGISQLPLTLTKIRIVGPIEQADASHILFHLPNIAEIQLAWRDFYNIDADGSCVTLAMLQRFVEEKKVDRLMVLSDCIVDPDSIPPQGIPNNDPNNPEMLKVFVTAGVIVGLRYLDWKLNESGFYNNRYWRRY